MYSFYLVSANVSNSGSQTSDSIPDLRSMPPSPFLPRRGEEEEAAIITATVNPSIFLALAESSLIGICHWEREEEEERGKGRKVEGEKEDGGKCENRRSKMSKKKQRKKKIFFVGMFDCSDLKLWYVHLEGCPGRPGSTMCCYRTWRTSPPKNIHHQLSFFQLLPPSDVSRCAYF